MRSFLVSLTLINHKTGEEEELFVRKRSRCYFKNPFPYRNYEIYLRLDGGADGYISDKEPVLDADIKDTNTKEMLPNSPPWHHTEKKYDPIAGIETYKFRFEDLELRLVLKRTMAKTFTADAILVKKVLCGVTVRS